MDGKVPGGPAFSTRLNYRQMRRFGATPAIASWCIALSGILSAIALAVVTSVGLYNGVVVFPNLGGGFFGPGVQTPAVSGATAVAAADFNGDGKPDLAIANSAVSGSVSVLLDTTATGATTPWRL